MQFLKSSLSIGLLAAFVGACSGGPAAAGATVGPGGGGGGGTPAPQATQGPAATQSGGGGGGGGGGNKPAGWDQYGKAHVELSGPASHTSDLGFVPAGSLFGGAQGSSFSFTLEGTQEILTIISSPDGTVAISYGNMDLAATGVECTTSNWNVSATSGSGSFDCPAAFVVTASGATLQGASLKGSFDAHT